MSLTRESQWVRRIMSVAGFVTLTAALVLVATFNANLSKPQDPVLKFPNSLLFQIRDDAKAAVLSVIIVNQGRDWFVVPRDAVVQDSPGRILVSQSTETLDVSSSARQISEVLSIDIEDSWQIDRLGISGLVDSIGGVQVTPVRDQVISVSDDDYVILKKGEPIMLSGMYASLYATEGSPQRQLVAFAQVWDQLLKRTDAANLRVVLGSLGSSTRATITIPVMVNLFEKLQIVQSFGGPRIHYLPTIEGTVNGNLGLYLTNQGRSELISAGVQPIL
ncbi:MAG: hypothetical protein RLZZ426_960 [Actinomycetota bacterium]